MWKIDISWVKRYLFRGGGGGERERGERERERERESQRGGGGGREREKRRLFLLTRRLQIPKVSKTLRETQVTAI